MQSLYLFLFGLLVSLKTVDAYGYDGHQIIGQVTWNLFSDVMKYTILPPLLDNMTMQEISIWADNVKHSKKYGFTRSWHYYDSQTSNPPEYCHFTLPPPPEDKVNLVNKLKELENNLTSHVVSLEDRQFAFRMMVHMLQDSAQPLHLIHVPGLDTPIVNHRGVKTNLHAYWDVDTVDQLMNGTMTRDQLVSELTQEAQHRGTMSGCTFGGLLEWMTQTEKVNCRAVWRNIGSDSYHHTASTSVRWLLKEAALYSHCYFTTLLGTASYTPPMLVWQP